ncbi:MAG: hypothetical protein ACYDH3_08970 [Candidatus Aminicenantales bacterium]
MKKFTAVFLMVLMVVGFSWSLPQSRNDIVKITIKNQFSMAVDFYINGKFACKAEANSSCSVQVDLRNAPFELEAWADNKTRVVASKALEFLAPGKNIIWSTGNVDLNRRPAPTPAQPATPPATVAPQVVRPVTDVTYMTSVTTLNYQGRGAQNLARTASFARIERQMTSTGAAYFLSGEGGLQVGKEGPGVFYDVSPVTVNRNAADRLSCDLHGLNPWLAVINGTLDGLTHKHMTSGNWDETLALSLGEGFPEKARVWFWARPLPEPDSHWILITADSGLLSFGALDPEAQDSPIYGRYRGVLVYSPTQDDFLQAAASFTLYHDEDQLRIEQLHYAADAEGNQLHPGLDVGPYLHLAPEEPVITAPGAFPSWCVQAAHVLDMLHLAVMTAAEGATNRVGVNLANHSILNPVNHETRLRNAATNDFFSKWAEAQSLANSQHPNWGKRPINQLGKSMAENITPNVDTTRGEIVKSVFYQKPLYYSAKMWLCGRWFNVRLINDSDNPISPRITSNSQAGKTISSQADKTSSFALKILGLSLAAVASVVLGLYLAKLLKGKTEGGTSNDFPITIENYCTQQIVTSFKINGTEYGPINKGIKITVKIKMTGSCTTFNFSYVTSSGYSGNGTRKNKYTCGFVFNDNISPHDQPIVGIAVSDCS